VSFVSVVCCQAEVSARGRSLVQRSPSGCGVSECDRETSIMRRPFRTGTCCGFEKKSKELICFDDNFHDLGDLNCCILGLHRVVW
jgi:hypothetical protein